MHANKAKLKRPSLALLRFKITFEIFELGLIAVQNEFQVFELDPIAVQIRLALLPCTSVLKMKVLTRMYLKTDFWGRLGIKISERRSKEYLKMKLLTPALKNCTIYFYLIIMSVPQTRNHVLSAPFRSNGQFRKIGESLCSDPSANCSHSK